MINVEVIIENPQVLVTRFTATGSSMVELEKITSEYVRSLYIDEPRRELPHYTRYSSMENQFVQIVVVHR